MANPTTHTYQVNARLAIDTLEAGSGEPLLFLHGAGGLAWDPYLDALAERRRVIAPYLPGTSRSNDISQVRDLWDLVLCYYDLLDALGIASADVVGHSMGGMIAAEMAALAPNDVSRLALICPAGLWDDDHPIADIFSLLPFEMPQILFHDAVAGAAMLTAGRNVEDPNFLQTYLVTNARQLGMAGRILFPIPERGLAQRLYRIKAKTVIVWGDSDRLVPPFYAHGFKKGVAGAELVSIPEAGHMVIVEKTSAVVEAIGRLG